MTSSGLQENNDVVQEQTVHLKRFFESFVWADSQRVLGKVENVEVRQIVKHYKKNFTKPKMMGKGTSMSLSNDLSHRFVSLAKCLIHLKANLLYKEATPAKFYRNFVHFYFLKHLYKNTNIKWMGSFTVNFFVVFVFFYIGNLHITKPPSMKNMIYNCNFLLTQFEE